MQPRSEPDSERGAPPRAAIAAAPRNGVEAQRRVLYILPQPFFMTRGSSFRARATVRALTSSGAAVDVVAYPFGEAPFMENVRLHRSWPLPLIKGVPVGPSWRKLVLDLPFALRCLALGAANRYDVLHGVEEGGFIAYLLSRLTGRPFVFDMHSRMSVQLEGAGFGRFKLPMRTFRAIESRAIRSAAAVITVSDTHVEDVRALAPDANVVAAYDFAIQSANADERAAAGLCGELGVGERPIVLYTGNLAPYQGLDLLIAAFALVLKQRADGVPPILLVVGARAEEANRLGELLDLVRECALGSHVRFVAERPEHEMGALMRRASVLVSPRVLGTNTPLKVYSYMSAERIIVATDIRSHTPVLDAECALLAAPQPEPLAAALSEALSDDPRAAERRAQCIANAKRRVEARYSEAVFLSRIAECYGRIPDRRARA